MSKLTWSCCKFEELGLERLYEILALRAEIFIVEQDCVYQDPDGLDQQSLHVFAEEDGQVVCYARLTPPQSRFPNPSIGRVLTRKDRRGQGLGAELMDQCIRQCRAHWPGHGITISAQQYLESFYNGLGFVTRSQPYDEDSIPHLEMELAGA